MRNENVTASVEDSAVKLQEDLHAALAEVDDLQQQLAAALADLDVARSDADRALMANDNLQNALEAFQSEREAELTMIEEQRREAEMTMEATHSAAMEALKATMDTQMREVQRATDAAIHHSAEEIKRLEARVESFRSENIQTRRSLDEAIHRLQTTQEDVIDRTLMKNILLDWLTKTVRKERQQVLEVMASVLHFSDEEKERVHLDDGQGSALGKVVESVTHIPKAKADVEHLGGDNVQEKWVSFLLAETD
jgi:chromosome segregation ATPase